MKVTSVMPKSFYPGEVITSNGSRTSDGEARSLCDPELWKGWQHQGTLSRFQLDGKSSEATPAH